MTHERLPGIQLFDLTDRVALVTGGSKGLGVAMAEGLASAGAKIAILSRNAEACQESAQRIAELYSVETMPVAADVADAGGIEVAVQQVVQRFGRIDVLINSAGINIRGAIDELTFEDFRRVKKEAKDGVSFA